jgi:excisionase family DNA binding protein
MPDPEALQQPAATDDNPLQLARTLTKAEACKLLGKSERTVNTYMSDGRLAFQLVGGKAFFDRAAVERLKADLDTPVVRGSLAASSDIGQPRSATLNPDQPGSNALARIDPENVKTVADACAAALRSGLQPLEPKPTPKPWLTLAEAVEYSGLPAAYLMGQAKASRDGFTTYHGIVVINVGSDKQHRWRFQRDSLGGGK